MNPSRVLCAGVLASGLAVASAATAADERYPPATLELGGYASPEMKVSTLAGDGIVLGGAEAGWILARTLVLGAATYTSLTDVAAPPSLQSTAGDLRLRLDYSGVRAAVIVAPASILHARIGLLVGGGTASSEDRRSTLRESEGFLVVEPDLELEVNLGRYVRAATGAGYRFIGNADGRGFTSERLGGPLALIAVRAGWF